jgi:PAS domain S-box-containing protein
MRAVTERRLFGWVQAAAHRRYAIAIGVSLLAAAFRLALDPWLESADRYSVQVAGLLIAGLLGGLVPGLLGAAACIVVTAFLFLPPRFTWELPPSNDLLGFGLFVVTSALVVVVGAGARRLLRLLQESETRLETALSASQLGTWRWRAHRHQIETDAWLRALYDLPRDQEVQLSTLMARVDPEDVQRIEAATAAARDGESFEVEFRLRLPDGKLRWLASRGEARRDERGTLVEIAGTTRDITRQKNDEAKLRASEDRFRALIEAMPLPAWTSDENGACDYVNKAYCDYTGTSPEENYGQGWIGVLAPADREPTAAAWKQAVAERRPYELTLRMRRHDGVHHWFRASGHPVHDERGEVARWIGVDADIDDIVRAREALTRSNDELEAVVASRTRALAEAEARLFQAQKMEALGQLTGGVAHDFNNLLSVVLGNAELLERSVQDAVQQRRLESIRLAAERGTSLTRQLLAFARRQELNPEPLDLAERLRGLDDMLARSMRSDVEIRWSVPTDLWNVSVDPTQFDLALLNLAVNARDAMPEGGVFAVEAANVTLRPGEHPSGLAGDFVRLLVRDTGKGMPPEIAARAFDPFFTTKDVGRGSGLGLSQVHGFAHQSGGTVRLSSRPGGGTEIELLLPRCSAPAPAQTVQPPLSPRIHTGTVLLVDDDEAVARTTAELLEQAGFEVELARDAKSALARLPEAPIDLVITDIVMPGGASGVDLARDLRRIRPGLPVLLMTGYAGGAVGLTQGDFPVLSKPFTFAQLQSALDGLLSPEVAPLGAEIAVSTDA